MYALKVLITSGGGQTGYFLNEELSRYFEILSLYHKKRGNTENFNSHQMDLTDYKKLKEVFISFSPNYVIHNAAISNSVLADKFGKEYTYEVNVKATEYLSELSNQCNSILIYTSTDLVYDGNGSGMLNENAQLNAISLYAESKLEGEKAVISVAKNYLILRTALMYEVEHRFSNNHFSNVYHQLKEGKQVKLFTDQFRSPFSLRNAAQCMRQILNRGITGEIINFGGPERLSRFELAEKLCDAAGLSKSLLIPVEMKNIDVNYKVYDVSMNTSKLNSYDVFPLSTEEYFNRFFTHKNKKY